MPGDADPGFSLVVLEYSMGMVKVECYPLSTHNEYFRLWSETRFCTTFSRNAKELIPKLKKEILKDTEEVYISCNTE